MLALAACLPALAGINLLKPIAKLVAGVIDIYLDFINTVVFQIQHLPYAYFDDIYISVVEMWLIYGLVFSLLFWLIHAIPQLLFPALLCATLLVFSQSCRTKQNQQSRAWTSFNIKGHTNLGYKNGTDLTLFVDSALYLNKSQIDFHCKPWFLAKCGGNLYIKPLDSLTIAPVNTLIINGDSLFILPQNKKKIFSLIPPKSRVFCVRPVYPNLNIQDLHIVAPSIRSSNQPKNWHSLQNNKFWLKPLNEH